MPTLKMTSYRFDHYQLPVITLKIGGVNHNFIVDTGAMETALSLRLASQFLTPEQHRTRVERYMSGVGGRSKAFAAHIKCTFIGVSILHTTFVDIVSVFNSFPIPISGLIGQDVLQKFASVEFDFKEKVIRFKP